MNLSLRNIRLSLVEYILEFDLELTGGVTAIFGPSGSGKTSLLDLLAGLRRPQSAHIRLDDQVLTDTARQIFVPTRERRIGYVPQDLALFPHLSVRQNLTYGFRSHRQANPNPHLTLERVTEVMEIGALLERSIGNLSGGEKQRVALSRALLSSPRLLLLDEPLASLDAQLKKRIIPYLARIRDEFRLPMLYVTHDRYETLTLAENIVVLMQGRVVQTGKPEDVFGRPTTLSVAGLVTMETIQRGLVTQVENGLATVHVNQATVRVVAPEDFPLPREVFICIRAEDVSLSKQSDLPSSPRNHLNGTVTNIVREGYLTRIDLDCGFPLVALLTKHACEEMALAPGDRVIALVKASKIHLLPR